MIVVLTLIFLRFAWNICAAQQCYGVSLCVSRSPQSSSSLQLIQSASGCIFEDGEVSPELRQQGTSLWGGLVLPNDVRHAPFQMWTEIRYTALNYSLTTVIEKPDIVSKIQISFPYENVLTTGEIPYIGNTSIGEEVNSTEFWISFSCASNARGKTLMTLIFAITGHEQLSSTMCKTEGAFSIGKSCSRTDVTNGSITDSSMPTATTMSGTHPSSPTIWIICSSVAVIVILLVAITTGALVHRRRKEKRQRQNQRQNQRQARIQSFWEINPGNIRLDNEIGKGAFSIVYKGAYYSERGETSTVVAVKCLRDDSQTSEKEMLLKEIELLKDMERHPNVLTMKGRCTVSPDSPIMLIMEYMNMGNLLNYLRENRFLKCDREECEERLNNADILSCSHDEKVKAFLDECLVITYQVSRGMEWMEKQHYVHRDLAARNVLLHALDDKRIIAKISDFGLARNVYESGMVRESSDQQKPIKWTAPEGLLDDIFTIKSDVWSFGVVLWEVASLGSVPYPGLEKQVLVSMLEKGHRMDKPEDCSDELYLLMVRCWQSSPPKRPRFEEIRAKLEEMVTITKGYTDLGNTENVTCGDFPQTFGESAV